MINIPGPAVTASRAPGPSGAAQLAAFLEEQKQGGKIVLEKLNHIEAEINKNSLTVKKLVEMGGVVKQVREQLAGDARKKHTHVDVSILFFEQPLKRLASLCLKRSLKRKRSLLLLLLQRFMFRVVARLVSIVKIG